ncbi:Quinoprotein amine dehydrogenase [Gracilaria domingensis]|nr:Quinoprotein amine dehydrogenase [Gracilaria domingensis]
MRYAPAAPTSVYEPNPDNLKILGSVSKYLILYNEGKGVVSCPSAGWRRRVSELLLDESEKSLPPSERIEASSNTTTPFPKHEFVSERFLEMPDFKAGFICTQNNNRRRKLLTICAKNGDTVEEVFLPLSEGCMDIKFSAGAEKQKVALLGGVDSQYIVYYTHEYFNVVLRHTGSVVKKWPKMSETMLIRGETSFNAPLITGIVKCDIVEHEKLYHVHQLEGGSSEYTFRVDTKDELIDVTRSRDGKTITKRILSDEVVKLWTVIHRDSVFHWLQALRGSNKSGVVEMRSNGSQVFTRPEGGDGRIVRLNYDSFLRVDRIARRIQGMSYDWARASWDGRLVVAVCRKGGFISMFDCDEGRCLDSITLGDELHDLILVDGHRLVALTGKSLIEYHFNRFCTCPLGSVILNVSEDLESDGS